MKNSTYTFLFPLLVLLGACNDNMDKASNQVNIEPPQKLKALIIDGENNHGIWPMTTMMLKDYLEESGVFEVDINRTKYLWVGPAHDEVKGVDTIVQLLDMYPLKDQIERVALDAPKPDPDFSPDFSKYDVVISNMGWKASPWPEQTKTNFENYMKNGGGLVIIHAANNSWGDWDEFNKMIGVGGWGGRNTETGPYVYYDKEEKLVVDPSDGPCGSHGPQYEFVIKTRAPDHPIMKGLPTEWLHTKDEMYDRMRGPAENMTVLATSFSGADKNGPPWNKDVKGTNRNEPMLATINYGKGRTFHTVLGHMDYSMECVGFITTFQRGSEWAATGNVTQEIPKAFPTKENSLSRKWKG